MTVDDLLVVIQSGAQHSVRSYRDTMRLLLCFVAQDKGSKITKLAVADLSFERVLGCLRYVNDERGNHVRTRNQRLAALHTCSTTSPPRVTQIDQQARGKK